MPPAHLTLTSSWSISWLATIGGERKREGSRFGSGTRREDRAHGVGGDNNRLDNSFVFSPGCSLGTVYRKYRASTNVFTDVPDWSREYESGPGEMGKRNDDRYLERMKRGIIICIARSTTASSSLTPRTVLPLH